MQVNAVFEAFHVWNRDQNRYERDPINTTMTEWIKIAQAVSGLLQICADRMANAASRTNLANAVCSSDNCF